MFDKLTETSLLYDFYGNLLTKKQSDVMELYHEDNLSLGEISQEQGISRQGVYDSLKKAEKSLREYEANLGLVEKFETNRNNIREIEGLIHKIRQNNQSEENKRLLDNILTIIEKMD